MVLSGRGLLTQEAKGFCERGYSGLLAWAPKPTTARGPTVTLTEANASIARRLRLSDATVGKWRKRYRMQGIEGLHDELRAGRPRTHDDERVAEVINTALQTRPPDGATHWSVRAMAEQSGVSKSTVQRWFSLFAIGSIRNFVLWAIVMKKKGASYGNREGTIGPAVGGA